MLTAKAELLRTAIGPNAAYYLERFGKMDAAGGHWVAGWNWPAFFVSTAWFQYRGLTGWAWANFFLPLPFVFILLLSQGEANIVMLVYVAIAFVVIPLYANALYYRSLTARIARAAVQVGAVATAPAPPTDWTMVQAALMAVFAFAFSLFFAIAPVAYSDYPSRAKVAEGLIFAGSIKDQVDEFYAKQRRLPVSDESGQFRADGPTKYTGSVLYDAGKKMIVITYGDRFAGKRVALFAEEREGKLFWICRTIDLDVKYLPRSCR